MRSLQPTDIDTLEAGSGPLVVLVHSSVSGARQWRKLIDALAPSFHVKAPNLFGYGSTPPWPNDHPQTLADQASIVEAVIPPDAEHLSLVGHSFGGAVAMTVAKRLGTRIDKLVLLEPNPCTLLRDHGREDAFAEISAIRDWVSHHAAEDKWHIAAERFADYWGGAGTWASTNHERRTAFETALRPNLYEWDAVMNDTTTLEEWIAALPARTLLCSDLNSPRPICELAELFRAHTQWIFHDIATGGHMAPLTRPDLVNPIVEQFLRS